METGIIGLSLSGKTTIFNSITGMTAETSAHSGGKSSTNIADVPVPDERVDALSDLFKPKKKVYATVRVKDVQIDFTEDGGIASSSMAEIRNSEAVTLVIRAFENEAIPHPDGSVDPSRDFTKLIDSLIFSDYAQIEKRLERLEKEAKKGAREYTILKKLSEKLENGELIGTGTISEEDEKLFSGFCFLTAKPIIIIINRGESEVPTDELEKKAGEYSMDIFTFRGDMEMEIARLPEDEQKEFLEDLGIEEPAKNRFLKQVYKSLHLMSFLTAGEDEARAWTIPEGATAVKAAGKIHTDLEKGFIRAEVIFWEDLVNSGGFKEAKAVGKLRLEGKDYLVKDGDVMNIRFNV
jgi:GTP-binding protein YchF